MFKWREIQTFVGFSDSMINYRNALAREVNLVFSEQFSRQNDDPKMQKEYEMLKNKRLLNSERIDAPVKRSAVEVGMLKDIFSSTLDFKTASLFVRYLGLSIEDLGKDLYFEMKAPESIYSKLIADRLYENALKFLDFFPKSDALNELGNILNSVIETKIYNTIPVIINVMKQSRYVQIVKDPEVKKMLYEQAEKAESDKRIEDARAIADLLGDTELDARLNVIEALENDEFDIAIENLKEISDKQPLYKMIIEYHNEEMKKSDIESFIRAFELAYHGGLTSDEYKRFLEKPAGKIFEHYMLKKDADETDYLKAEKYIEFANKGNILNALSEKFLDMIEANKTSSAANLKNRFRVEFIHGRYSNEQKVILKYKNMTETSGMHGVPKGEENLRTALDMVKIFDLGEKENAHVHTLFFKHFMNNKIFKEAKKYFVPGSKEIDEMIEEELMRLINAHFYEDAYKLKDEFDIKFNKDLVNRKKREVRDTIKSSELPINLLTKEIVINDIFGLDVISGKHYNRIIDYVKADEFSGVSILTELKIPITNNADSSVKVALSHLIESLSQSSPNTANILSKTYEPILPPSFLDYIVYYVMRFLGLE